MFPIQLLDMVSCGENIRNHTKRPQEILCPLATLILIVAHMQEWLLTTPMPALDVPLFVHMATVTKAEPKLHLWVSEMGIFQYCGTRALDTRALCAQIMRGF